MSETRSQAPDLPPPMGKRALELVSAAARARVVVIGDLMLDHYITGRVDRISPEAPVPVLFVEGEEIRLGGAANVAANVAALGATCQVVGVAGEDEGLERLIRELRSRGIGEDGVVSSADRPTTTKTRLVSRSQQVARFDREVAAPVVEAIEAKLIDRILSVLDEAEVLVLEDYNKGVLTRAVIHAALRGARDRGVPVVVDPKRHHFFDFTGATVFKPNLRELEDALGTPPVLTDRAWLEEVRRRLGVEHLLLTLGDAGMLLQRADGSSVRLGSTARSVYDVSGAGDTVTAVVAVVLAAGGAPEDAAMLANLAAGVQVGKAGVGVVTPDELMHEVGRLGPRSAGSHVDSSGQRMKPAGRPAGTS